MYIFVSLEVLIRVESLLLPIFCLLPLLRRKWFHILLFSWALDFGDPPGADKAAFAAGVDGIRLPLVSKIKRKEEM